MMTNLDDARVLVDRIIGDLPAAPRRALLQCFAESILLAQAARPGGWALTVPGRGRVLRLSVGWVEMVSLYPDELTVTVSQRPPKALARMYSRGPYRKVPEQGFIRVPLRHADVVRRAYRSAREAHEAAVRAGAREELTPTLRRAHVPALVELLRQELRVDLPESWTLDPVDDADAFVGEEGGWRWHTHRAIERDRKLVELAKKRWRKKDPRLPCSACGFSFVTAFGVSYIEAHHRVPLSDLGGRATLSGVDDLMPVCANCHQMLHHPGARRARPQPGARATHGARGR